MSVREQEQQRQRRARQQPIIYEDSNVGLPDPKSVPAPPTPKLDTCLDVVSTALANPNRAMLRRVFFIAEDVKIRVSGILPCPRLSAASRIRRRQETASVPKRSTTANNGRQHRLPVQRSVYKRTF